jgi:CMP-N-acetylneuraminic acid synthetase
VSASSADGGVLCIIPARATSQRFPRKNLALIGGCPLVGQAVRVARASGVFRHVCVSSESDEVLAVAREHGADLALPRTGAAREYQAQVKDVCRAVLDEVAAIGLTPACFAVALPTSPLRSAEDFRQAHRLLTGSDADGCMSVVACDHPPQRALSIAGDRVRAYFGDQFMKPAQTLEPLYRHDGAVLFMRTEPFLRTREFYGNVLVPYVMPRERAVDVDDAVDLAWAEFLLTSGVVARDTLTA